MSEHRLGDLGKRGAAHHATCACGEVCRSETADGARAALREHIERAEQPGGDAVVSLSDYREQERTPIEADGPPGFPCPEPGCGFSSTRPQGLSRHRNQTHGTAGGGTVKKRHARHEAPPAALDAVGYEVVLTLDSDRTDVLAALAFVEERNADELIREAITAWLDGEVDADPALAGLAAARARRRA